MTQQGESSLSGQELRMLRVLGAASERRQNFSVATRFRSGRWFMAKRVLRESNPTYSRLCGPSQGTDWTTGARKLEGEKLANVKFPPANSASEHTPK